MRLAGESRISIIAPLEGATKNMPRLQKNSTPDPEADARWLAYEVATNFSMPALCPPEEVSKLLGIDVGGFPALEAHGIITPAGNGKKGSVKKYILRTIVDLRGKPQVLDRAQKVVQEWVAEKNAKKTRNREKKRASFIDTPTPQTTSPA